MTEFTSLHQMETALASLIFRNVAPTFASVVKKEIAYSWQQVKVYMPYTRKRSVHTSLSEHVHRIETANSANAHLTVQFADWFTVGDRFN